MAISINTPQPLAKKQRAMLSPPFKFLDAYQKEDISTFFGRATETEALYNALSGVKHLVVSGASGVGKTSLVECGLRNQFSDADWFAMSIHKGANINASVFEAINAALDEKIELDHNSRPLDEEIGFGEAVEQLFSEYYQPIYLIFDQLETLLIEGNKDEQHEFFRQLNALIRYKVPCRILLIIQEKFLGNLAEFESFCPTLLKNQFRLEAMRTEQATETVTAILDDAVAKNVIKVSDSKDLAAAIIAQRRAETVHLPQVQAFLSYLWEKADGSVWDASLFASDIFLEDVIPLFFNQKWKILTQQFSETDLINVLPRLISSANTTLQRSSFFIAKKLAAEQLPAPTDMELLFDAAVAERLLRKIPTKTEVKYEFLHDSLADVAAQSLAAQMQQQQKVRQIYALYAERSGVLSAEDLQYLQGFEGTLPYPDRLREQIERSQLQIANTHQQAQKQIQQAKWIRAAILLFFGLVFSVLIFQKNTTKKTLRTERLEKTTVEKNLQSAEFSLFRAAVLHAQTVEKPLFRKNNGQIDFTHIEYEAIERLCFQGWNIEKIPNEVFLCKNLKILDLRHNELRQLPAQFQTLIHLDTLYLQHNLLEQTTKEVKKLLPTACNVFF